MKMLRKVFAICCFASLLGGCAVDAWRDAGFAGPRPAAAVTGDLEAWIDARVAEKRMAYNSPSFTIAIVSGDGVAFEKAYGVKDLETKAPATLDTTYQIASITKTFVGVVAAEMAIEGAVDLDAPITDYVPEIEFHPSAQSADITLRLLLSHQAGFFSNPVNRRNIRVPGLPDGFDPTIAEAYDIDDLLAGAKASTNKHPVGERYSYSNFGMHLAGYVLARADGAPTFADLVQRRLLTPLAMTNTFVRTSDERDAGMATPYAYGDDLHHKVFPLGTREYYKVPAWTFGEATGGAGLSSTAPDLAKYILGILNAGDLSSPITQQTADLFMAPNTEFVMMDEVVFSIGLGWRIMAFGRYGTVYSHGGHNDGHHGFVVFSPEKRLAVIALTNGAHTANRTLANEIMLKLMQSYERGAR
ncbi:MAG: serine hydrolase domain-containing protein [Pseudomonadota bacterium]